MFMSKKLLMCLATFILCVSAAVAQTKISGTVVSAGDNEPVIGATVTVVGTKTATVTDFDGHFSLFPLLVTVETSVYWPGASSGASSCLVVP